MNNITNGMKKGVVFILSGILLNLAFLPQMDEPSGDNKVRK